MNDCITFKSKFNGYETMSFKGNRNVKEYLSETRCKEAKPFEMISYDYETSRRIASIQAYNKNYKISSFKK